MKCVVSVQELPKGPAEQDSAVAVPFWIMVNMTVPLPGVFCESITLRLLMVPLAATIWLQAEALVLGVQPPTMELYQVVALSGGNTC